MKTIVIQSKDKSPWSRYRDFEWDTFDKAEADSIKVQKALVEDGIMGVVDCEFVGKEYFEEFKCAYV